jgi:geranylgeranyl diphosphate synthase type II
MNKAEELLQKVNDALASLPYDREPASLYEPISYVLALGGKRIRPVLMMLAYSLFRDDPETIMPQALGIETFHNYTLLHDDLMDNADMRRGHATVHRRWNANKAILSGDAMLILAYRLMARCADDRLPSVLSLFSETALEIMEGQEYDVSFETRTDVAEAEYIEMIRLKTSVLLACALKMGALLAGASSDDADLLYRVGEQTGLAFQLQDDLLDVYGDPKVFGKAIGGDITSNKKTYMLINAFNRADDRQRAELSRWISAPTFDRQEKIAAVTRLYDEIGIRSLCEEKINHYFNEACKHLDQVAVAEERKAALRQYIAAMMKREF